LPNEVKTTFVEQTGYCRFRAPLSAATA